MPYQIEIHEDHALVRAKGEIVRIQDCIALSQEINKLIDAGIALVILEMMDATSMSGSFCGFLSHIAQKSKEEESRFVIIARMGSLVYQLLETVGLNRIIEVYPSKDQLMV